ncbi:MAG: LysR family transcriptional regulator [Lentisphaeria bacterium]|nr:LysR family transcriptional regulator [Lentisphaeria bacterium]
MELTALRYFVTVAHELHFHRAAEKLHMTQAPLSAAIRKLEDELEVRLFERTSRSVKLTEAGAFFLPEAEAVLSRAELARKRLAEKVSGTCGRLSIGYNETAMNNFLPEMLARCRERRPDLQLELRELETGEQLTMLKQGRLDIGLMRPFGFELSGLESRLVSREKYRLVMPERHRLARRDELSGTDLAGQDIILFAREVNPAVYDRLTAALTVNGAKPPHFRQDARNKNSMLAMVKAGFGAALLPESCCRGPLPGLAVRELRIALPPVDILAVWDPGRLTEALKSFISLLPGRSKR